MSISNKLNVIYENTPRVYESGKNEGFEQGKSEGLIEGIEQGIEQGKQIEYNEFWDIFQENGNRTHYSYTFGNGWTTENFKPKYSMQPQYIEAMFRHNDMEVDLVEYLESIGITLDTSNCKQMNYAFYFSNFTRIGEIDCRSLSHSTLTGIFGECGKLKTIDKLILSDNGTLCSSTFDYCFVLENLTIEGKIGLKSFSLQWSTKLSHDSLLSVLNALLENTTTTTYTLTLGKTNLAKLTDTEKAIATEKGWTLA